MLEVCEAEERLDGPAGDRVHEERVDDLDRELDVARALEVRGAADDLHVLPVLYARMCDTWRKRR